MRRISLTLVLLGVGALAGCMEAKTSSSTGTSRGVVGQFFFVNLFTPPTGGIITSDVGGIDCGASGATVNNAVVPPQYVYAYYPSGVGLSDHCGQTQFLWGQTVTLTATGRGGNAFLGWAGDCAGIGTCILTNGADKTVVAIFGAAGSGHPNFADPGLHGPAYFGFLSGTGTLKCTTCHGPTLAGQGVAPSCTVCHAQAGWVSWQDNCSFCHGARNATTKAGYDFAAHPAWAAPPDAISQRLTGTATADRTGAHQAHLLGVTPSGLSVAPAFLCATCHPVPTNLSHISGSAARAVVVLSGAGQASLPASLGTYSQSTGTCATYCHGAAGSPPWSATHMACNGCHGVAPPSPHPYTGTDLTTCAGCHADSINSDGTIKVGGTHLDGNIQATGGHPDFTLPSVHGPAFLDTMGGLPGALSCNGCHGASYGGGIGPSCNACHATNGWTGWQTNCSFCHGAKNSNTQQGYSVANQPTWSAPPDAIAQRLDPAHASVPTRTGAHQAHLTGLTAAGASFAPAFTCATCHALPGDLSHIGGSASRATVALAGAGQASLPASLGTYDPSSGSCATYCHGRDPSPAWATTGVVCGSCHALPPPTSSGHPNVAANMAYCSICHPDTMNADGTLNLAGGKHLDGIREASGMHGDYSSPATHGPRFFDYLAGTSPLNCKLCHGANYDGGVGPSCNACHLGNGWTGSWQTNCSFCHGAKNASTQAGYSVATHPSWSAPPDAIAQRIDPAHAAVPARTGAHQAHLSGVTPTGVSYAAPFTCATCHAVPTDLTHIAGATSRASVALAGAGQASLPASLGTYVQATGTCSTYCHGTTLRGGTRTAIVWSDTNLPCNACHFISNPSPPHTAVDALGVAITTPAQCNQCHPDTVRTDGTIDVAGGRHLNGILESGHGDFSLASTHAPRFFDYLRGTGLNCRACHGQDFGGGSGPSCNACHLGKGWTASWQTNCSFCHGTRNAYTQTTTYGIDTSPLLSAPPDAISQRLTGTPAPSRTGAHVKHLTGRYSANGSVYWPPYACATCHTIPADYAHAGGPGRAAVTLKGTDPLPTNLGSYSSTASGGTCTTYCHGSTMVDGSGIMPAPPSWAGGAMGCASCHGYAPASGQHELHVNEMGWWCTDCHAGTDVEYSGSLGAAHLNGVPDVQFYSPGTSWDGSRCTSACHTTFSHSVSWR